MVHTALPRPFASASAAVLLSLLAAGPLVAQEAYPHARLSLDPCSVEGVEGDLRCGTLRVLEDRDDPGGRRLALEVTVLPATGDEPALDPVIYLAGGPGAAATGLDAAFENLPGLRRRRDVVLLDQRGTGGPNRLDCDLTWGGPEAAYTEAFLPVERVSGCRKQLASKAGLKQYTTPIAADDLDALRWIMGYGEVNLWGDSYGTRAALVYLRRHGEHVRSVILGGPDLSFVYGPVPFALAAEMALERLGGRCRRDAACRSRHFDLAAEVDTLLARLEQEPAPVRVAAPTGDTVSMEVGRHDAAEAFRYLMYDAGTAVRIPGLVERAMAGDVRPLASLALRIRAQLTGQVADGMYLSVDCAEAVSRIGSGDLARADAQSFLGGARARQRTRACGEWPR
ncbi:MAG: alpha/beta fold hydrolase, partial [Gemmatimonadota bacterium]